MQSGSSRIECSSCGESGYIYTCASFRLKTVGEREKFVETNNLSSNCSNPYHTWNDIVRLNGDASNVEDVTRPCYAWTRIISCSHSQTALAWDAGNRKSNGVFIRNRIKEILQTAESFKNCEICNLISMWNLILVFLDFHVIRIVSKFYNSISVNFHIWIYFIIKLFNFDDSFNFFTI